MEHNNCMVLASIFGSELNSSNNSQQYPIIYEDIGDTFGSCIDFLADFRKRIRIKDKHDALLARKALRRDSIFENRRSSLYSDRLDIIKRNFKWINYLMKEDFYVDYQETLDGLNLERNNEIVTIEDDVPAETENSNNVNFNFNGTRENIITIEDDDEDSPPVHEEKPNISNLSWIKMENVEVKEEKPSSSENVSLSEPLRTRREHNHVISKISVVKESNNFIYAKFENLITGEEIPNLSPFSLKNYLYKKLHTIFMTGISRSKKGKKRNIAEVDSTPGPSGSENKRIRNIVPQNLTDGSYNLNGENITESKVIYANNIGYWIPKIILEQFMENDTGPSIEFHTNIDPVCNDDRQYVGYNMFAFVGDLNGHIGFSTTYSENYSGTLEHNKQQALLNMFRIKRYAYKHRSQTFHTIAFQVYDKSGDIKVIIMPGFAKSGRGTYHLDVSEAIRLAGIDDCKVIVEGYTGGIDDLENIVKATFGALKKLIDTDHTSANF